VRKEVNKRTSSIYGYWFLMAKKSLLQEIDEEINRRGLLIQFDDKNGKLSFFLKVRK